jgi:hypothetical protein
MSTGQYGAFEGLFVKTPEEGSQTYGRQTHEGEILMACNATSRGLFHHSAWNIC